MKQVRKSHERGHANHGWLDSYHTFSFADYHDPAHMSFRALRVMNEDRIAPASGFGMHPHRDMEIVTYVLQGALEHRDSLGNGEVLRPGEFQRMSAGTGIRHSEFNPSNTDAVHLYQIWLLPGQRGISPGYEQKVFGDDEKRGRLRLVASPDGADGSLTIHQDAKIYLSLLDSGQTVTYTLPAERHAWLQVLRGTVRIEDLLLEAGDGLAVSNEPGLTLTSEGTAEVMLFDLP